MPPTYRIGVKNRWLLGDLDHLLLRLFERDGALCLPDGAPSRWRTLIEFVRSTRPGVHDQIVSGDDPGPFLYELRAYARNLWASVAQAARRRVARARLRGLRFARPSIPS